MILTLFIYNCVYCYPNLVRVDRDDALEITSQRVLGGKAPYDTLSPIGNVITTGTSSILYATLLNERHLAFIFWLWIVCIFYNGQNFLLFGLIFLLGGIFFARSMLYRLEELYFGIIPFYYAVRNVNKS